MVITCLCNAGLMVEHNGQILLIDLPNSVSEPFVRLSDEQWNALQKYMLSHSLCGFFFTHDHPDHLDPNRLRNYLSSSYETPYYIPNIGSEDGTVKMGPFLIEYHLFEHAPLPMAPIHVTAIVEVGGKSIYISADAKLDCDQHHRILRGRKMDAAFWNSMYLSRPECRELMKRTSEKNYIYHLPARTEDSGIWKKVERNLERYGEELKHVHLISDYPTQIIV